MLFGNVNLYASFFDGFGNYAHNLLSAVQLFGVLYLLALLGVIYFSYKELFHLRRKLPSSNQVFMGFMLLNVAVLSVLFGKYVGTSLLWLALGHVFMLSYLAKNS